MALPYRARPAKAPATSGGPPRSALAFVEPASARQDVVQLVFRRGLMLAAIGVVLALGVTRLLANFLYGVSPFDATAFVCAPLLQGLIPLLACWLPARRAMRINPMEALRHE